MSSQLEIQEQLLILRHWVFIFALIIIMEVAILLSRLIYKIGDATERIERVLSEKEHDD